MEIIEQLKSRSSRFVWSSKIKLVQIPGRGNSVICAESLNPNEQIIHIPTSLLVNISTTTNDDATRSGDSNFDTQELLALELIRRKRKGGDLWVDTLLALDFSSMPMTWPEGDLKHLSKRYQNRIAEQKQQVADFAKRSQLALDEADWAWKAVNTRCLYWEQGGMTLAPALDYLNHTCDSSGNKALRVQPSSQGITVTTQSGYNVGDELTFSYGPHENGFLLVEYGFTVEQNPWDFVDISEEIAKIVDKQRDWLIQNEYWGDWTIDNQGQPSFRVEVALASIQAPNQRLLTALINGYDDGSRYESKTKEIVKQVARGIEEALKSVLLDNSESVRDELKRLYSDHIAILSKV